METAAAVSTETRAAMTDKEKRRQKRHTKIRAKLSGTAERPRISVYRSNQHTYVQVIDDENQKTLCAIGTMSSSIKEQVGKEEWKTSKLTLKSQITTLEPYTESLPCVYILVTLWAYEASVKENDRCTMGWLSSSECVQAKLVSSNSKFLFLFLIHKSLKFWTSLERILSYSKNAL